MLAIICPFNTIIFMFSLEILSVAHFCRKNDLKLFVLSNYSSSFWYSNTIRIVFPERVTTRYSICTDLIYEYIFGTRFVRKFGIRSNSGSNPLSKLGRGSEVVFSASETSIWSIGGLKPSNTGMSKE